MTNVLFLCTGNYYRSRLAEVYFNHVAKQQGYPWQAYSRGLQITGRNVGPISQYTQQWLKEQGIPLSEPIRFPIPVQEADFWRATHIIAVKEAEHRNMVQKYFPHWADRVRFWNIHDLDAAEPQHAIPELVRHVEEFMQQLRT